MTDDEYLLWERVAIMHFDGGLSLAQAQFAAAVDLRKQQEQPNLFLGR